jgi:hypothetical protein
MEKNYQITPELKKSISFFLTKYMEYEKCLEKISQEEKTHFTEEEINLILNLLGSFPLSSVFHIVERFKTEVSEISNETVNEENNG